MRYKLSTLIDITNTGARRGDGQLAYRQHQNYLTVLQTLGLRTNIDYIGIEVVEVKMSDTDFGTNFKGKKKVWEFTFEVEREGYHSVEDMTNDFDFVPIITDLEETVKIDKPMFMTNDLEHKNIIFEEV